MFPPVFPFLPTVGKTTTLQVSQPTATQRQVNITWTQAGVSWGFGPRAWEVSITPPAGATLTATTCADPIAEADIAPTAASSANNTCSFTGSADGTYSVTVTALGSPESAPATIDVAQVAVPGKPQQVKVLPGPNELVVSWQPPADPGSGIAGYHAEAVMENAQSTSGGCDTTTELTCTIKDLVAGNSYRVYVSAISNKNADFSSDLAGSDLAKVLAPVTSAPTPPASVPASAGKLTAPSTSVTANQSVTLSGTGYAAHVPVQVVVYSTPQVLKTVTTDGTGAFSTSVTLPAGLSGSHTLVAGGVGPDGAYRYLTLGVTASAGGLPVTGAALPKLIGIALLVLAFGVVLVRLTRRRRFV
ncbi:fibronectin type III domain-containing protein [Planosporangium flavigriseum]|uniref:fibronectin type III domain-containing protein n=1 Tax=Planosporangium flavigriseum TaxID=373681 RepID=UPI00143C011E|nr:fibronectin type III domain-containing protein [Planosporangium flavigriseum]NJC64349.1 fibronectin type III domain-containing protein [Planosporangium flavigriseum]